MFFYQLLPSSWVSSPLNLLCWANLERVGLVAMSLVVPAAYHDVVTVQVCDLAVDRDWVSAKLLRQ